MRKKIILICSECLSRNYSVTISSEANKDMVLKKFCKKCNKHTIHKITK